MEIIVQSTIYVLFLFLKFYYYFRGYANISLYKTENIYKIIPLERLRENTPKGENVLLSHIKFVKYQLILRR
jgi:hypothetical protein